MARFFFDTNDGEKLVRDEDGLEFVSHQAACREAIKTLPDIALDMLPYQDRCEVTVDMRDEAGKVVFTATLSTSLR